MQSSNKSSARVIADSISPAGKRIVTVEAKYWRALHSEVMTHRDRARNAASSRAIPFIRKAFASARSIPQGSTPTGVERVADGFVEQEYVVPNCTWSMIKNDPFIPEFIGAEQRGMQSGGELEPEARAKTLQEIYALRDQALEAGKKMYELGVHKSILNRYLEPWAYITVVMTATEWNNFFRLRVHPKAEKHFAKVAKQIKDAIEASAPRGLHTGQWHLPYVSEVERTEVAAWLFSRGEPAEGEDLDAALCRISSARCARVSYLTHDGKRDFGDDIKLFNNLIHPKVEEERDDDVIHASPLEHVAYAADADHRSGPFVGWSQFRKRFVNENVAG